MSIPSSIHQAHSAQCTLERLQVNAGVELEFIKSYSIWIAISAKHQMQKVFVAESANQPKTRSRRKTKSGQNTDNFSSTARCSGFAKYMLQQVEYCIWSSNYNMHNFNYFNTLKMMVPFKEKDFEWGCRSSRCLQRVSGLGAVCTLSLRSFLFVQWTSK